MLRHLTVRNLAIVDSAEAEFTDGLNIITGETGAGKSVLMGALSLLLGERADKSLIRSGEAEAAVEGTFEIKDADAQTLNAILEEGGLPLCEDNQLIIRRTLPLQGNGRCQVNAAATTTQFLKRLGEHLIDIHGPYDHQSLFSADFQRDLLDAFGRTSQQLNAYRQSWSALKKIDAELEALQGSPERFAAECEHLTFIVEEITAANLSDDDDENLIARHAESANAEEIVRLGSSVTATLLEGDDSIYDRLVSARRQLADLAKLIPEGAAWQSEIDAITVQAQELAHALEERIERIETDPDLLQTLEERIALVHRLKRKYGGTVASVLAEGERAQARLSELQARGATIERLQADRLAEEKYLSALGTALTAARQKAATKLTKQVTSALRDLGFLKAEFSVVLEPADPTPHGADHVIFRFAPNPGEYVRTLAEIASSGEVARIMLAIKAVLAEHDAIPILVFDEIDANVGGATGRIVGVKLQEVARSHQVISITHLPQVAVFGQNHLIVSKRTENNRTVTAIRTAQAEARVEEIARMLGGKDSTSVTLEHARELLANAQAKS